MSQFTVPLTRNTPWYSFRVVLGGVRYELEARYNLRMDRWTLSIYDAAGAPVLMGIPLLIDRNLTPYPTLRVPVGSMFVKDNSGRQLQPTLPSFLTDHVLVYDDTQ